MAGVAPSLSLAPSLHLAPRNGPIYAAAISFDLAPITIGVPTLTQKHALLAVPFTLGAIVISPVNAYNFLRRDVTTYPVAARITVAAIDRRETNAVVE